jgi:hypothetical protein
MQPFRSAIILKLGRSAARAFGLAREFFAKTSSAPNSDAIQSALNIIEARAAFDGPQRLVYVRVGTHDGRIYLDLADEKWRAVEISSTGWQIVDRPPVRFRRAAGMLPLPEPVHGGKIEELRPFLNIGDNNNDFVLTVSFVLAALRERGPYPALSLIGEHGSAKSTFAAVLRKLIDPNSAALRALPREDRDLFIAANNAHLLAFDNISKVPDWISDTLCRLATGGGFATRQLYSDQDEALFDAMRPIILNGIEDFVGRPDLADRAIFLNLKNITEDKRRSELSFWADFERAHPRILGAVLDGVAHGLRQLPGTSLKATPRMADFALWATACEQAFWEAGTFAQAYEQNRDDAVQTVIEADLVATAVQSFMAKRTEWQGTSTDLLGALKMAVAEDLTKLKEWPSSPRSLSGRLRRAAATLRKIGTDITFDRDSDHSRNRTIRIARKEGGKDRPNRPNPEIINDLGPDGRPDGTDSEAQTTVRQDNASDGMDDRSDDEAPATVRPNTPKNKVADGVDGSDAKIPTHTGKDENGGEPALSTRWPGLSPRAVDQLAREFSGLSSAAESDDAIRTLLAKYGVPVEAIGVEVEMVVRRIEALGDADGTVVNFPTHAGRATEPEVLGSAPAGGRCAVCGKGNGVKRIKHGGEVNLWHEDCGRRHLAAMADPPVKLPDLGPDPLDEHGAPRVASVPFMLTQDMKRRLRAHGYSDEEIAHLTPQQANEILAQEGRQPNA